MQTAVTSTAPFFSSTYMGMGSGHNKTAALSMYLSLLGEDKDGDEVMRIATGLAYNKQP